AYLPAYRRCRERKPVIRSVVEAVLLAARWRCLPFHYLRYGLYDRSFELRNIMDYLPETVLYYRLLPRRNHDTVLLDDKLVCKRILAAANIPQAQLLLSGDHQRCVKHGDTELPAEDADRL